MALLEEVSESVHISFGGRISELRTCLVDAVYFADSILIAW